MNCISPFASCLEILLVLSGLLLISAGITGQISLPNYLGSNMVLPRDHMVTINGKGKPNTTFTLKIANQELTAISDDVGFWSITLNQQPAGGPFEMHITGGRDTAILSDILFGDLWLCSGQSNMQYTLDMLGYSESTPSQMEHPELRIMTVETAADYMPAEDISGGSWKVADSTSVGSFSATAYFFGRYLTSKQSVPIGLISSNLGATTIETWMSIDALESHPQFDSITSGIQAIGKNFETLNTELTELQNSNWEKTQYLKGPGMDEGWYRAEYDDSEWQTCSLPMFWEYLGFEDHDGSFWFRKTIELTAAEASEDMQLHLNQIDDYDRTWVNGQFVGETFGSRNFRNYTIPAEYLHEGSNTICIRVFDIGGLGGAYTNSFWGNPLLNSEWKYKVGRSIDAETFPKPVVPNASPFSHPSVLYNANIAPLRNLPIKGVIWYQGESNEYRAEEYRELLRSLILDWRDKWNNPKLPFLIVQLANYRETDVKPGPSRWAELREAQMKATRLPNVDIAAAIDIGNPKDIHPFNKKEVGRRLALLAMHYSYGSKLVKGPTFERATIEGQSINIKFNLYEEQLIVTDKYGYIRGFSIAGSDGEFKWARAKKTGPDEVEVYSEYVINPKFVRYAWSDNPGPLDLFNSSGLPVFPFRTDTFRLSTSGIKFEFDPHSF